MALVALVGKLRLAPEPHFFARMLEQFGGVVEYPHQRV